MLTNVIFAFVPKNSTVLKLMSWKHSFKRLNEEYEIAQKKKQALDNLFETGKISQSTRDSFNDEIIAAIAEIEKQQKDLLAKMQLKMHDLESQIKTLETILANYEIQHVVGEIEEDIYQREITLLSAGLETAKHELDTLIDATKQLCSPATPEAAPSTPQESEVAPTVEAPPVETVPITPAEVDAATEPCPQEPAITMEETAPIEAPPVAAAEVLPAEAAENTEEISQEPTIPVEETAVAPEQPTVEAEDIAPVETAPAETEVAPVEATETAEETVSQESVITMDAAAPETEQPQLETAETVPFDSVTAENTEVAPTTVETSEAAEIIPQEPAITLDEAAPEPEPTPLETEEATVTEAAPEENTDTASVEVAEATENVPEETIIITEEAQSETLSAENTEVTPAETAETVEDTEEIFEEPLITIEDTTPEIDQSSDEDDDVLLIETAQSSDDAPAVVEEVVHAANPRDAPHAAQPEIVAETITDEAQAADDTTAEDSENQEE